MSNLANFLNLVKVVLGLLPAIIEAVKAIEAAFPQGGAGAQKLELIRGLLANAYATVGDTINKFEDVWKIIQPTIGSIVVLANSLGVFKK